MTAQKYRSKPVEIEAFQWVGTPEAATPILNWIDDNGGTANWTEAHEGYSGADGSYPEQPEDAILIRTLEGEMRATAGDWIIRGTEGEFYPCKDSVFRRKYEPTAEIWMKTTSINSKEWGNA